MKSTDSSNSCSQAKAHPLIDEYTFQQVRHHSKTLVEQFGFPPDRQDDLQQEMMVFLLKAEMCFNPDKSRPHTFVSRVLANFCKHFRRQESLYARNGWKTIVGTDVAEDFSPDNRSDDTDILQTLISDEQDQELHAAVKSLPVKLRKLAYALMKNTEKRAVARDLGIGRNSLYRRLEQIRRHFKKKKIVFFQQSSGTHFEKTQM